MKKKGRKARSERAGEGGSGTIEVSSFTLSPEARRWIVVVSLVTACLLAVLSLLGAAGSAGAAIDRLLGFLFGNLKFVAPVLLGGITYLVIWQDRHRVTAQHMLGLGLLFFSFSGFWHVFFEPEEAWLMVLAGDGGGLAGFVLGYSLRSILGFWAATIVLLALLVSAVVVVFNTSIERMMGAESGGLGARLRALLGRGEVEDEAVTEIPESLEAGSLAFTRKEIPPTFSVESDESEESSGDVHAEEAAEPAAVPVRRKPRAAQLSLQLLSNKRDTATSGDIKKNKEIIQNTLAHFGIAVEMGETNVGPTVSQYTFKPGEGIKLERITALHRNIALALASSGDIRIEAPIPGKALVGIEVPNPKTALVSLREILESEEFKRRKNNLCIALGKDVTGRSHAPSLAGMPHLLIAGTTGSGKSVCIDTIINSLLFQNGPEDLRFIMIDPKKVSLTHYNDIPHLMTPVVTETRKAINALNWTISEMERRYELLRQAGKKDIASYNKDADKLPYIVVIIDELAEIMMASAREVEALIVRVAQLGRAAGIHLILATQRPSVDVITGLIKANITTRVAFAVPSGLDSRTILDTTGAERLVGKGDMLFSSLDSPKPVRIQGVFVSDPEILAVTTFLKENGEPAYETSVTDKPATNHSGGGGMSDGDNDDDPLLSQAKEIVIRDRKASASLLQRRLKVGYARAARLLDLLEEAGVIGPGNGAHPREVYATSPEELDIIEGAGSYSEEDERMY